MRPQLAQAIETGVEAGDAFASFLSSIYREARRVSTTLRIVEADSAAHAFGFDERYTSVHHELSAEFARESLLLFPTRLHEEMTTDYSLDAGQHRIVDRATKVEQIAHDLTSGTLARYTDESAEDEVDVSSPTMRTLNPVEGALASVIESTELLPVIENHIQAGNHTFRHILVIYADRLHTLAGDEENDLKARKYIASTLHLFRTLDERLESEFPTGGMTGTKSEIRHTRSIERLSFPEFDENATYSGVQITSSNGGEIGHAVALSSATEDQLESAFTHESESEPNAAVVQSFATQIGEVVADTTSVEPTLSGVMTAEMDTDEYAADGLVSAVEEDHATIFMHEFSHSCGGRTVLLFGASASTLHGLLVDD